MTERAAAAGLLIVLFAALAGCRSGERAGGAAGTPEGWTQAGALETQRLVALYDARTARLERLWARVTFVIDATDAEGTEFREQAEGHLQIELPSRMALTLGKLGDPRLYLGSNDERYWWIDTSDADRRVAAIGRHALVTQEKIDRLGITVRPLDVVELLGIRPIGEAGRRTRAVLRDEAAGIARLLVPRGDGLALEIEIDAERGEPTRITMVRDGQAVAESVLDDYQPVVVVDDRNQRPRVARRMEIRSASLDGVARLALYDPENRPIREIAFDLDRLLQVYRVNEVADLDAPVTEGSDGNRGVGSAGGTAPAAERGRTPGPALVDGGGVGDHDRGLGRGGGD